ncbi:helix-turn-helix domain-containing protein [Phytomonospora endophytica]|uniref:HTH cro/C1-type domain-containing protein n=1 Tax=Phytomonospora endophytica TaxID=714109 RepID=A0A841G1C0_9ACTN|nr:helix-turn-helix transcriptional regulator [Phytomonospora endophytica]MBB6039728.1 hypothetical protein [Phytomonospora endophytica]GIG70936.1 transcriptional regulator [Phytomonospora endophytica]
MADKRFQKRTLRGIWLGKALEEIRVEAGLTARDAAAHIRRDPSSVSRMEDGRIPVSEEVLDGYLDMCGITDPHRRADLATIRRDAAQSGWWDGYKGDVVATLMDRAWIESKAVSIRSLEMNSLPGLLQTPAYAEGVMRLVDPSSSDVDIARWLEVRMTRQHILTRHDPIGLVSVIDESLLQRVVSERVVMKAQLDYLLEASERQNVELRVLPSSAHAGVTGSFEVFDLMDPYPEVAYVGTPAGDICVEGPTVEVLSRAYDRFLAASLDPAASRGLIIAERDNL